MSIAFALVLLCCSCSFADPCSGPITYNNTDFTIRGPCPNDVVIAPVNNYTVQYRCDYKDRRGDLDLPYWHIPVLSGSPFIVEQTNDHELVVYFSSAEGYTTIDIPVQQQYLNHTLVIQCGLCKLALCSSNPLSENISSSTVGLVAFSTPSSLNQVILADTVSLSWSPPLISVGYTDLVEFDYNVTLSSVMEGLEMVTFKTQNAYLNVSRYNITMNNLNPCNKYEWSVTAMVGDKQTKSVRGDMNVSLQTEPRIKSGISVVILPCDDVISFVIGISVTTLQPLDTLNYSICLINDANEEFCFNEPEINQVHTGFVNLTVLLTNWNIESLIKNSSDISDILCDYTVLVHVRNECGQNTSEEYKFNSDCTLNCTPYQPYSTATLHQPYSSATLRNMPGMFSTSISAVSTSKQTGGSPVGEMSNADDVKTTIIISVSVGSFITIIIILCAFIPLSLYIWLKKRRGKFGLLDRGCGGTSSSLKMPTSYVEEMQKKGKRINDINTVNAVQNGKDFEDSLNHPPSQEMIDDDVSLQHNNAYGLCSVHTSCMDDKTITSLQQNEAYGTIGLNKPSCPHD